MLYDGDVLCRYCTTATLVGPVCFMSMLSDVDAPCRCFMAKLYDGIFYGDVLWRCFTMTMLCSDVLWCCFLAMFYVAAFQCRCFMAKLCDDIVSWPYLTMMMFCGEVLWRCFMAMPSAAPCMSMIGKCSIYSL